MSSRESTIDVRLVPDVDRVAFAGLPLLIGADDARGGRYAVQLAESYGNAGEFQQYLAGPAAERLARIDRLLRIFRENVELLVHKTWVEKSEEKPKERLLEDLMAFEGEFREGPSAPPSAASSRWPTRSPICSSGAEPGLRFHRLLLQNRPQVRAVLLVHRPARGSGARREPALRRAHDRRNAPGHLRSLKFSPSSTR